MTAFKFFLDMFFEELDKHLQNCAHLHVNGHRVQVRGELCD